MRAYSVDLRSRIVAAVQEGHSLRSVAVRFSVSAASVSRYVAQHQRQQSLAPKPSPGAKRRLDGAVLSALLERLSDKPDQTLEQLHRWLKDEHPANSVSRATLHRTLLRAGLTYKKSHWLPQSEMKPSALPGEIT